MKDFDIAKYLREHQLGSYGILNHYVDLKPLKEEVDINSFNKFMTSNYGHISHNLSGKEIAAFLNREDIKGLPIEQQADLFADYLVSQGLTDTMAEDVTPEEVAEISYEGSEPRLTGNGEGDSFEQAETISEDDYDAGSEQGNFDRMMDLAHIDFVKVSPVVKSTIDNLRDSGFDDQDILDFLATDFTQNA